MKRLLILMVLVAASCGLATAQTAITPICAGANDTARFTSAANTLVANGGGTIKVPRKTTATMCAVNTITIPAGVTVDQTEGRIKVNTGQTLTYTIMPIAGDRQIFYNIGAGLGTVSLPSGSVKAAWFGGNAGVQIGLASAALSPNKGEIVVTAGGGTVNTTVEIFSNQKVVWDTGTTYTCSLPAGGNIDTRIFVLHDNVEWDGHNTTIIEPVGTAQLVATYGMTQVEHTYGSVGVTTGINIHGMILKGNTGQTPATIATGARSMVALGNCHECYVQNNVLYGASDLGVTAGGTGLPSQTVGTTCSITSGAATLTCPTAVFTNAMANQEEGIGVSGAGVAGVELQTYIKTFISSTQVILGVNASTTKTSNASVYLSRHAEDVWITDNKFENYTSQAANNVNGHRVTISRNHFKNGGKYTVTSGCAIDFEPNHAFDAMDGHADFNEVDNSGSIDETGAPYLSGGGICIQNPGTARNYGPFTVIGNTLRGGADDRPENPRMTFGIFLLGANKTKVANNTIVTTSQACVSLNTGSNYNTIENNTCVNSGGGGLYSLELRDSLHNTVRGNRLRWDVSAPAVNADSILETGTADYNIYKDNTSRGIPTLVLGTATHSRILDSIDEVNTTPLDFTTLNRAFPLANDTTTGTLANKLVSLTGAPAKGIRSPAGDQAVIGIASNGAGKTGLAHVMTAGIIPCRFDNPTVANDFVTLTTNAIYSTGTVATDTTSAVITGTGTTFLSTHGGGNLCVGAACAEVNFSDATHMVVASGGGWPGVTASGQAYTLDSGGMCHDAGATYPTGQVVGRVLTTNASNTTANVHLRIQGMTAAPTFSGAVTSTVSTGTAPLTIASTTKVSNLNVDFLDGCDWAAPCAIGSVTPSSGQFSTLTALTGISAFSKGANVASAGTITATGNLFHVTGTTTITSVSGTSIPAGTRITIIFDGALTFTDGSNLVLNGNFVTTADDTITLVFDGTSWYEVARSVN